MMNKILIRNGFIDDAFNGYYNVFNNEITFKNSGTYYLEYNGDSDTKLTVIVDGGIDILLVVASFDNNLKSEIHYIIKDSTVRVNKFYCNKKVIERVNVDLLNEYSRLEYYFSNICLLEEEYEFNINHMNKKTISNISNKAVALNNSKLNYVINSNVDKDMDDSLLEQTTRIITFGKCDAKIIPNMFIDFDNVIAKHGSVIGTIQEDMIFYLMSRGIEYNEALKLIIKGYLFSNVMFDYDLRSKVLKIIDMYWR